MKTSLYLETSVVGAYLDNEDVVRRDLTIRWWEHELGDYRVFISDLVSSEIERTGEPQRTGYRKLIEPLDALEVTDEAAILAEGYLERGIFQRKYLADAVHVATAAVHRIDYFVTWNFGNIANVRRQARLKYFNRAAGFHSPAIVTPEFLVHTV